jgi:hypothetical protein
MCIVYFRGSWEMTISNRQRSKNKRSSHQKCKICKSVKNIVTKELARSDRFYVALICQNTAYTDQKANHPVHRKKHSGMAAFFELNSCARAPLWTFVRQMQESKPFTIVQNIPGNKLGSHIQKLNNSVIVMMNTNFTGWDLEYMVFHVLLWITLRWQM